MEDFIDVHTEFLLERGTLWSPVFYNRKMHFLMFFISFLGCLVVGASGCDAPRLEDTPISQHAFPPLKERGALWSNPGLFLFFLFRSFYLRDASMEK